MGLLRAYIKLTEVSFSWFPLFLSSSSSDSLSRDVNKTLDISAATLGTFSMNVAFPLKVDEGIQLAGISYLRCHVKIFLHEYRTSKVKLGKEDNRPLA